MASFGELPLGGEREPEDRAGKSPLMVQQETGSGQRHEWVMGEKAVGEEPSQAGGGAGPLQGTECSLTILPYLEDSRILSLESHR